MNYTKKQSKAQKPTFTTRYSPEFQEFITDTYRLFKKWSGHKIAKAIGEDAQLLDYHAEKGKHGR